MAIKKLVLIVIPAYPTQDSKQTLNWTQGREDAVCFIQIRVPRVYHKAGLARLRLLQIVLRYHGILKLKKDRNTANVHPFIILMPQVDSLESSGGNMETGSEGKSRIFRVAYGSSNTSAIAMARCQPLSPSCQCHVEGDLVLRKKCGP